MLRLPPRWLLIAAGAALVLVVILAGQERGGGQFPGGTNPDGSLRPSAPLTRLFTQDAYTEYQLLEPGTASFRIKYLPEQPRAGATEIVNATRGGSKGSDIEVYDPRTGKPVEFTYEQDGANPDDHAIRAKLPRPVPAGGIGRVIIYKTYADPRTYQMNGGNLVWVRSLSGYRLGVVLPRGFGFVSSNVAAQVMATADGRLKLAFANPSGQANPVTIHARPTTATFKAGGGTDMFFDDIKTLYDLDAPATGRIRVEQTYSDYRKGATARLDSLVHLPLRELQVVDLDTAQPLATERQKTVTVARLEVPVTAENQSAHLRITGVITDGSYRLAADNELVFERSLHGLRNTVVLPEGWDVAAVSQSGTIGTWQGRTFVALINLNAENQYKVTIRARQREPR
jgi:hypothetical protein